jgi:peptidoglycan/xylan/chitin deacetylase (PgdA/CDA1 family)
MSSLRHRLLAAGFAATAALRADRWLRPLAQGSGVILMFHHVRPWSPKAFAPNRILEITPEFLDRVLAILDEMGFELVGLDEVPARLAGNGRPFAALTFDDGYRDTVEHALPILHRYAAPFTVFVTTEFADGTGRLWWLELEEAIASLDRVSVTVGGETITAACATAEEKQGVFERLYWALRQGPESGYGRPSSSSPRQRAWTAQRSSNGSA